jgi:hypothetical protein
MPVLPARSEGGDYAPHRTTTLYEKRIRDYLFLIGGKKINNSCEIEKKCELCNETKK